MLEAAELEASVDEEELLDTTELDETLETEELATVLVELDTVDSAEELWPGSPLPPQALSAAMQAKALSFWTAFLMCWSVHNVIERYPLGRPRTDRIWVRWLWCYYCSGLGCIAA